MDVLRMTRELIGFNTVSAESNVALGARLIELLEARGFAIEVHAMTDAAGRLKHNIIGRRADSSGATTGGLLLSGHSDTVPFRPDQKANLSAVQEGGLLYGRGACDMKGAIAAQLEAADQFRGQPLRAPLTLAFTCDEEVGCRGAKALIGTNLLRSRFAIIGEPTSLKPVRMHKGYSGARVTLTGKAAHSSDPRRGVSALKAAARVILALEELEADLMREPYQGGEGYFEPDYATLNIGVLNAGVARNVIPEVASFTIELRPLPRQDAGARFQEVERVVREVGDRSGVRVDFEVTTKDSPMETAADAEVVRYLEALTGSPSGAVAFSTEGKEFNQMGMESVILGPGTIDKAHQEDEFVPIDELGRSVDLYAEAIRHFCG